MKRLPFLLLILLVVLFVSCPTGGEPEDTHEDDDDDTPSATYFSWTSPDLPEESIFSMGSMESDADSRALPRWVSSDGEGSYELIEPDGFLAAYSYIGLVPETMVDQLATVGFQAYRRGSGLVEADTLDTIDTSRIPGYYDNAIPGSPPYWESGNPVFESYVDDGTTITRDQVKDVSFVIYDSADHGGELKVFDVTGEDTFITLDDLPDDLSVQYTGVASQLIYYQCDINDYGSIRFYFNNHGTYYAGDVVVDTGSGWKWAYLQHGDGIDAECFTNTSNDPSYSSVTSPDDPENPSGSWSSHPYVGLIDLTDATNADESGYDPTYTDLYTYLFDFDLEKFGDSTVPNGTKRPTGTGGYSYLMASNDIMNIGYGSDPNQFTYPHLDLDEMKDIGGYASYTNDGDPDNDEPFKHRPGDLDDGRYVSGYHQINLGGAGENTEVFTPGSAFIVYHEDDFHAYEEDLTSIVYLDARLDHVGHDRDGDTTNDVLLTRKELKKYYGWYAWDSGLYSTIYDDGNIIYTDKDTYGISLNPLYFSLGRMHVYADAPFDEGSGGPTYSDSWFDRIISLKIELQLRAGLRYATDSFGKKYGNDGSTIGSGEFERRFLSFIPDWIASPPASPVAKPYHFQGVDDVNELPFKFMVVPEGFKVYHTYVHYSDVYTKPPDCYPLPEEGPFTDDVELTLRIDSGDMDAKIFYTLDGSAPVVSGSSDDITSLAAGNAATKLYTAPFVLARQEDPITVTIVGYERKSNDVGALETKECSLPREATYTFAKPGSTISCQITDSGMTDGTPLFAGLFGAQPVSLEGELNPLYWGNGTIASGSASFSIEDVPDGTYHLCVLADIDKNGEMSTGDKIYPVQGSSPSETHRMSATTLSIPSTTSVTITGGSWSTY